MQTIPIQDDLVVMIEDVVWSEAAVNQLFIMQCSYGFSDPE